MRDQAFVTDCVTPHPLHRWHLRLGHLGVQQVAKLKNSGAVTGVNISNYSLRDLPLCNGCVLLHQKWITTIGEVWLRTYIHGSNTSPQPILPQIALPTASRWGLPRNRSNIQCCLCAGSTLSIYTNINASKAASSNWPHGDSNHEPQLR